MIAMMPTTIARPTRAGMRTSIPREIKISSTPCALLYGLSHGVYPVGQRTPPLHVPPESHTPAAEEAAIMMRSSKPQIYEVEIKKFAKSKSSGKKYPELVTKLRFIP